MTPYQFGVKMAVAPQAIDMNATPAPTNTTMGQNLSEQLRLVNKLTSQGRAVPGQPGFSATSLAPAPAVDPRGSGPRGPLGVEEAGLKARGPLPAAQLQSIYGGASRPAGFGR